MRTLKTTLLSILAIVFFSVLPTFAQNSQQKAQEIRNAENAAMKSDSATKSRGIGNEAWDGAKQGNSTNELDGKQVDVIGGNSNTPTEDNGQETTITPSETENVTPWESEMDAVKGLLGGILGALALAAIFLDAKAMPSCVAGIVFCGAAILMSVALMAVAMVIMFKYQQFAMGGVWLATGTALLVLSIYAMVKGIGNARQIHLNAGSVNAATEDSLHTLTKFLGVVGVGGGIMDANSDKINEKTEKKDSKK